MTRPGKQDSPFGYFNSSPEIIRLVVMMYVRFPLSLRNVEDLLFQHGITSSIAKHTKHAARPPWLSGKILRLENQLNLAIITPVGDDLPLDSQHYLSGSIE